jgi:AcrR family transcriptional regulator
MMTASRRAPRKSPAARRDDIVRAVLALLAEGGAPAASTPAIARSIGVTQSALFKHFDNKEGIWRAVMDHIALEVGARLGTAAEADGSHADRLLAVIRAYLTAVRDIPAIPALLFSGEVQAQGASSYLREEIARRFGWFHDALLEPLRAGQASGEFRRDLDIEAAAVLAAGIAQSVILRLRIADSAIDMTAEAERVFPILLAGLR